MAPAVPKAAQAVALVVLQAVAQAVLPGAAQVVLPGAAQVAPLAAAPAALREAARAALPAVTADAAAQAASAVAAAAVETWDANCRGFRKRRGKLSPRSSCSSPNLPTQPHAAFSSAHTQAAVRLSHFYGGGQTTCRRT